MAAKTPHKIGTLLGVGFACILIISTVVVGVSFWKLKHIAELSTQVAQSHAPINIASDRLKNSINGAEAALNAWVLQGDKVSVAERKKVWHEIHAARQEMEALSRSSMNQRDNLHSHISEFNQLTWMLLLALLLSVGIVLYITRRITGAISSAVVAAESVAVGGQIPSAASATFETERLMFALQKMVNDLDAMLNKIRASEAQTKAIVETANDAIITIDGSGIITSVNPATGRLFGFTEYEMIGQNVKMLMSEPERGQHDGYLRRHIETGEKHVIGIGREVAGRRKDGSIIPVFLTVSRISSGKKIAFCGVLHDLTREKSNQKQLIQADKLASLGTLTTGIAHELRQPLAVIRLATDNAQALIEDDDEIFSLEEASAVFQQVVKNCDRMNSTVDHLRSFARDSEHQVVEKFDLRTVLESCFSLLGAQLRNQGIKVSTNITKTPVPVRGNPNQLEQVLINLLTNSRDALKPTEDPLINIVIQQMDSKVTLILSDNGPGIPLEIQHKIFDPFFTTKEIGKGTGLGLSISHGIINDHGGTILYSTTERGGAQFTITLPIAVDQ